MKDLYLKTNNKQKVEEVIKPFLAEGEEFENYVQTDDFALDWIGQMPVNVPIAENEEIKYVDGLHFNVRLLNEECAVFESFESAEPETPYRKFL